MSEIKMEDNNSIPTPSDNNNHLPSTALLNDIPNATTITATTITNVEEDSVMKENVKSHQQQTNTNTNNNNTTKGTTNNDFFPPPIITHSYPPSIKSITIQNLTELKPIGKILNVVDKKIIIQILIDNKNKNKINKNQVIQRETNFKEIIQLDKNFLKEQIKIDIGSILFNENGKAIGKIVEIMGSIINPFYVLIYPDVKTIKEVFEIPLDLKDKIIKEEKQEDKGNDKVKDELKEELKKELKEELKEENVEKQQENNSIEEEKNELDLNNLDSLPTIQLKSLLSKRGLETWGKRKLLINRLIKFENNKLNPTTQQNLFEEKDNESDISSDSEEEDIQIILEDNEDEEDEEPLFTKKQQNKKQNENNLTNIEINYLKDKYIYYHPSFVQIVNTDEIINTHLKSYDVSADDELYFSDDEEERLAKKRKEPANNVTVFNLNNKKKMKRLPYEPHINQQQLFNNNNNNGIPSFAMMNNANVSSSANNNNLPFAVFNPMPPIVTNVTATATIIPTTVATAEESKHDTMVVDLVEPSTYAPPIPTNNLPTINGNNNESEGVINKVETKVEGTQRQPRRSTTSRKSTSSTATSRRTSSRVSLTQVAPPTLSNNRRSVSSTTLNNQQQRRTSTTPNQQQQRTINNNNNGGISDWCTIL